MKRIDQRDKKESEVNYSSISVTNGRKIRILFFIDQLTLGGTEKHFVQTLRFLDRNRFEPQVYVLHGRYDLLNDIKSLNIPVVILNISNIVSLRALVRLFSVVISMRRSKFDIVQTFLFAANIYGILAAKLAGIPIRISTRRELVIWKKRQHRLASRLVNLVTHRIIANSRAVKEMVVDLEQTKSNKVEVVYNGVDIDRFEADRRDGDFRAHLGVSYDVPVIVNVARYRPLKGQKYFIEACAKVAKIFPKARFAIVGPVYDKQLISRLHQQSETLAIKDKLSLLSTWRDTPQLYAGVDVVVLSSLEEGFANVIIEAMASAKPVIATKVGGNVEAIQDGITGLLVPPADSDALAEAMCRLLRDRALASEMGRKSRTRVLAKFQQQFMWDEMQKHYNELLQSALS